MMTLSSIFGKDLHRTVLASVLSLVFVAVLGGSVLAGELPKQGTYETEWTFSGPYTSIDLGEEDFGWISNFTIIRWNTSGGELFKGGISADCIGMGGSRGKLGASGYCIFIDGDGDNIYEYWYDTEDGKGVGVMLGGTGKYKGIQGEDHYENVFTADAPEGTFHGIGSDKGSYTITP